MPSSDTLAIFISKHVVSLVIPCVLETLSQCEIDKVLRYVPYIFFKHCISLIVYLYLLSVVICTESKEIFLERPCHTTHCCVYFNDELHNSNVYTRYLVLWYIRNDIMYSKQVMFQHIVLILYIASEIGKCIQALPNQISTIWATA